MPHILLTALRMIVVTNVQTNRHVTVCTCVSEEIEEIKESKEMIKIEGKKKFKIEEIKETTSLFNYLIMVAACSW